MWDSELAWGTPPASLGRSDGGLPLLLPNTWHNFFSIIQQENEMFSISESARRRFLLFQRAFKQVIKARVQELAYPPVD